MLRVDAKKEEMEGGGRGGEREQGERGYKQPESQFPLKHKKKSYTEQSIFIMFSVHQDQDIWQLGIKRQKDFCCWKNSIKKAELFKCLTTVNECIFSFKVICPTHEESMKHFTFEEKAVRKRTTAAISREACIMAAETWVLLFLSTYRL